MIGRAINVFASVVYIFPLILFSSCSGGDHLQQKDEKEQEAFLLRTHHVKACTEFTTVYLLGRKQAEHPSHYRQFDKQGNMLYEVNLNSRGDTVCTIRHSYSEANLRTLSVALNLDGSLLYRETLTYDEKGRREELIFYLPDGTYKYRNVSAYDQQGNLAELSWFWPEGFKAKNTYQYKDGKKISDTETGPQGDFRYKWQFRYDSKGCLAEAVQYYPGEKINTKVTYEYDDRQRLFRQVNYNGESVQMSSEYQYNEKGLKSLRSEYSSNGKLHEVTRYVYEFEH